MPVQPTVVGSREPSNQAQMAGLASDLSSSGDFREPSTMTAMERLMAEQNAVPPMLRDVSLDDTQAGLNSYEEARALQGTSNPEAFLLRSKTIADGTLSYPGKEDFMDNLVPPQYTTQPDAPFDLGSFLEAMYPNGDPTVLSQDALPKQPVSRKQTVLERKGLESMFGGPDLSNYTGERTTFSDVMTNPAYDASLDNTQAIVPETPFALNSYMESMFPDGESNPMYPGGQPIADAKLRDVQGPPTAPTESYVPPERKKGPAFSAFGMPTPADYQTTFPISSQDIYTDNLAKEQNSTKKRVEQIDSGISAIETELAKDPFNADIKRRLEEAKRQRDAAVKAQQEAISASEVAPVKPKRGGTGVGREDGPGKPVPVAANTRPGPSTPDTGLSFGADVPAMKNPGAWGEGIALTFGKTGNPGDATGVALSGLGVKPAEDLKSRNKQMQDLFKEMFGDSDEDVAKEKYLNLAMIGFAIASGASGNALTNISQGMMQGVSKMLEDQKDRKGRDEKLKYAAFNMASDAQIRADDRATALIDYESKRKDTFKDALTLYSLKKDRDDESKTFLDTDKGKGMQKLFESLNTASGSPAAALTQMSTAYSPEDMKIWQSASGILGTPAALSEEQQALFNKYNKP